MLSWPPLSARNEGQSVARHVTPPRWPPSSRSGSARPRSQSRRLPSSPPLRARLAAKCKLTQVTALPCPSNSRIALPRSRSHSPRAPLRLPHNAARPTRFVCTNVICTGPARLPSMTSLRRRGPSRAWVPTNRCCSPAGTPRTLNSSSCTSAAVADRGSLNSATTPAPSVRICKSRSVASLSCAPACSSSSCRRIRTLLFSTTLTHPRLGPVPCRSP
mmetsp:Transcript_60280/g.187070  ORF Transcript_60280/g.187070 Transcript_60280/m.187070 type:complete len:217 (+) Transcript_60280:137-787(+)